MNREKYSIPDHSHLVVVGNPPYNDHTSKNKKKGKNAKESPGLEIDKDIRSNDLGICFLRAFDKLNADVICVLHPLSYLIKETNFTRKLGEFKEHYKLIKAVCFSSREFADTQNTPFPVAAALYVRDSAGMNYEDIRGFEFDIHNSDQKIVLSKIETIDGYIRKYPPAKNDTKESDIGLYMYNIRDINSLLASGNLTEKVDHTFHITVNYKDLYKYAYLNCMKRYFEKDFRFGNLSPIVDKAELENNEQLQDIFIIDTILNNQHLSLFKLHEKDNLLHQKKLLQSCAAKSNKVKENFNAYDIFLKHYSDDTISIDPIKEFIKAYFNSLKKKYIS